MVHPLRVMHFSGRSPLGLIGLLLIALTTIVQPARSQIVDAPPAPILDAPPAPLFADDVPLSIELTLDFDSVLRDRAEQREYQPGALRITTDGSAPVHLDLTVKTRGYYRLHWLDCDIPPLRLNFKKKQVVGTVFEGQDKLKLVTHCRNKSNGFQQRVLKEYLLYKTYNLLTERSFRARLVDITYVDSRGRDDPIRKYGFLIEDEDRMAERNGAELVASTAMIHPEATDRETMTLLSVFQYMIGNTDWGVSTRHNIRLIYGRSSGILYAVPYDFDWAGLVDAPYATPDPKLGIRSVSDRRFMGFCRSEEEFGAVFERIAQQEDAILALFTEFPLLEDRYAERATDYLREFFDTIRPPAPARRDILRRCL